MSKIDAIILGMSKQEVRSFKLFMSRIQLKHERKVLQLFDIIRSHPKKNLSARELSELLPGSPSENTCYQLKKRLRDYLDRAASDFAFSENSISTLQLFNLGVAFKHQRKFEIAWDYFERACIKARAQNEHEILNLILSELVHLCPEIPEKNPETIINESVQNRKKIIAIQELDEVLILLGYKLAMSQQTARKSEESSKHLKQILDRYRNDSFYYSDPSFRLRMIEGVSQLLLEQHAYAALAEYLGTQLADAEKLHLFGKQNHEVKCKLYTWWTNSLFKAGAVEESLKAANELKKVIDQFEGMLAEKYFIFYNSAMVYANTVINLPEAVSILEATIQHPSLAKHPIYSLVVHVNLALCLYETGAYKRAVKLMSRIPLHPAFHLANPYFRLKIALSDLILKAKLDQWDAIATNCRNMQKEFAKEINEESGLRIHGFLKLMLQLAKKDGEMSPAIEKEARAWLKQHQEAPIETEVINVYDWIKNWINAA
jgi:tetratricopeptide (TPR) repeat protein